jgi:hypothetical protein
MLRTRDTATPTVPARDRAIAHRLALFVQREERRVGDAVPQCGAVGGECVDAVGVDGDADRLAELRT